MNDNLRIEKRILRISMVGSIAFLVAELVMAYVTGSHAVLMDCVFDIADLIMIGPFLLLVPLLYKPMTERRPYGFAQVESLFVIIKCTILVGVTIALIVESIGMILEGGNKVNATAIAIFEIGVSVMCILMYITLSRLNRKYSSPSIKAELYIWKLDAMSTMGVGVAFLLQLAVEKTPLAWLTPYVDPAIAMILAILLLKEPISMVLDALKSLVLFAPKNEIIQHIREVAESSLSQRGYKISFLDIIKTGRKIWIETYIIKDGDTMCISELKEARQEMMETLSEDYDSIYITIAPEIEEEGESQTAYNQTAERVPERDRRGRKTES